MRKRTRARELAVKVLYQVDLGGQKTIPETDLDKMLKEACKSEEISAFARELIKGFWENSDTIDQRIEQVSHNWKLDRMAVIDRNIIRLAAYELMFRDDVPALVSINEAIEIAKKFSTRKSGSFVNGVLDSLRKKFAQHKPCGWDTQQQPQPRQKSAAHGQ
jgi:transcription antitermination factor NusB